MSDLDPAARSPFFYAMKSASKELIARSGGLARAERIAGVGYSQLSNYQVDTQTALMSLPVIHALEAELRVPVVSAELVRLNPGGWTVVRADQNGAALAPDASAVIATHADVIARFGDLAVEMAGILKDMHVTPAEGKAGVALIVRLKAALESLTDVLTDAQAKGGAVVKLARVSE